MNRRPAWFKLQSGRRRGDPGVAQWMDKMRHLPVQKQMRTSADWVICHNEFQDRKENP